LVLDVEVVRERGCNGECAPQRPPVRIKIEAVVERDQVFCIIRDGAGVGAEANEVQGRIRIPQRL